MIKICVITISHALQDESTYDLIHGTKHLIWEPLGDGTSNIGADIVD